MNQDLERALGSLNDLLSKTDLSDVTSESSGYTDLPDGYYLSEVEKAELKLSKSGKLMVAFQYKIVQDGLDAIVEDDDIKLTDIKGTKNRKLFKYYLLEEETSIKKFVTDMLKFEGGEEGVPLLEKECFTNSELINDALEILIGLRIYIQVSTSTKKDGTQSQWQNLTSWKRAAALTLPLL